MCTPIMVEAPYNLESGAKLQWYEISGVKKSKGELLAAFELYEVSYYFDSVQKFSSEIARFDV